MDVARRQRVIAGSSEWVLPGVENVLPPLWRTDAAPGQRERGSHDRPTMMTTTSSRWRDEPEGTRSSGSALEGADARATAKEQGLARTAARFFNHSRPLAL